MTSLQVGLDLNYSAAATYLNSFFTGTYSQTIIDGVAAHEVGHVLGLNHSNACVLMQPSTLLRNACNVYGPVQDDINGVNSLY
jgi:predicted Zn-dependent protease